MNKKVDSVKETSSVDMDRPLAVEEIAAVFEEVVARAARKVTLRDLGYFIRGLAGGGWQDLGVNSIFSNDVATERMRVPGGWIYRTVASNIDSVSVSTVFVPDA